MRGIREMVDMQGKAIICGVVGYNSREAKNGIKDMLLKKTDYFLMYCSR